MLTTIDGITKQEGSEVFYINYNNTTEEYFPQAHVVVKEDIHGGIILWDSRELCEEQCRLMNL